MPSPHGTSASIDPYEVECMEELLNEYLQSPDVLCQDTPRDNGQQTCIQYSNSAEENNAFLQAEKTLLEKMMHSWRQRKHPWRKRLHSWRERLNSWREIMHPATNAIVMTSQTRVPQIMHRRHGSTQQHRIKVWEPKRIRPAIKLTPPSQATESPSLLVSAPFSCPSLN